MATRKQKAELMEVLKFTPCTVNISVSGYGSEMVLGRLSGSQCDAELEQRMLQAFRDRKVSVHDYASFWYDEDDQCPIPEELQPFAPGSWYDCDSLAHVCGAEMCSSSYITVEDSDGTEIWRSNLDPCELSDQGIECDSLDEVYAESEPAGAVVFFGQSVEKGTFFGAALNLTAPFDPKKLCVTYQDVQGLETMIQLSYDGEELYSDDYSTMGKSAEFQFMHILDDRGNTDIYNYPDDE